MCADEKKFQSFVWEILVRCRDGLCFLGDLLEKLLGILPNLITTSGVNQAVARGVQQPRFRFLRNAVHRPSLQGRDERVAERAVRTGDITRACRREILSSRPT